MWRFRVAGAVLVESGGFVISVREMTAGRGVRYAVERGLNRVRHERKTGHCKQCPVKV